MTFLDGGNYFCHMRIDNIKFPECSKVVDINIIRILIVCNSCRIIFLLGTYLYAALWKVTETENAIAQLCT